MQIAKIPLGMFKPRQQRPDVVQPEFYAKTLEAIEIVEAFPVAHAVRLGRW
jgi:hypothetical protein